MWYGDNRHGTGWTLAKLRVLGYHYEEREKAKNLKPKAGGKLFIIKNSNDDFRYSWDISEEKNV